MLFIIGRTLIIQRSGKSARIVSMFIILCTKFGQLVLRKIIEIVATRYQILRRKCTKFDFDWSSASDNAGGAYSK